MSPLFIFFLESKQQSFGWFVLDRLFLLLMDLEKKSNPMGDLNVHSKFGKKERITFVKHLLSDIEALNRMLQIVRLSFHSAALNQRIVLNLNIIR
ncbi:MAG: hypothetical protein O3C13_00345 [Bacteroidetes bacterium]|nr:hypothetical protein [Bacteroidota bacterium]MDA0985200.1 hypothetical protein [Bacteroidota bacterium]